MTDFDFSGALLAWYDENKRDLPWRHTKDPYAIWVSETMLQQTRVEAVKPYYLRFLGALPDVNSLANADPETLNKLWQGLGYYSRARNLQKAAKVCVQRFGGRLPESAEELKSLPGVGEYTAGAVSSIAFGRAAPAVDGNVLRTAARYLLLEEPVDAPHVKKEIAAFVRKEMDADRPGDFNQALIELGATLCLPGKAARCGGCPLLARCKAFETGRTEEVPVRTPKKEKRVENKTVLILQKNGKTALEKRSEKGLLAGLWQPPTLSGALSEKEVRDYLRMRSAREDSITLLPEAQHVFTHVIWKMRGYLITLKDEGTIVLYEKERSAAFALPSAFNAYKPYLV